jgi:hypothetical protein
MKHLCKLAILSGALALSAAPAVAATAPDGVPPTNQGTSHAHGHSATPPAGATLPAKAHAYGKYCQGESKKHVDGQKGTPFSQCVTAMAKLANGASDSPSAACKQLSKKHLDGQKGTPFSQCVTAAAKLLGDQA